jgi:hypothetical protein
MKRAILRSLNSSTTKKVSDSVKDALAKSLRQGSDKIANFFSMKISNVLRTRLIEVIRDKNAFRNAIIESKYSDEILESDALSDDLVGKVWDDIARKDPDLAKLMILIENDNLKNSLKKIIKDKFDINYKSSISEVTDEAFNITNDLLRKPEGVDIIKDYIRNLPEAPDAPNNTLNDLHSYIKNSPLEIDDFPKSIEKVGTFGSKFRRIAQISVLGLIGGGLLAVGGIQAAQAIVDKLVDRESFAGNVIKVEKESSTSSLIITYSPPLDWTCKDIVKIESIEGISPSINGQTFYPDPIPSNDPNIGKLRLSPIYNFNQITVPSGNTEGLIKCLYGTERLLSAYVVETPPDNKCTVNGRTYYNCALTGCSVEGDSDCILRNEIMYSNNQCNNNNKKRYFMDISSIELGNGNDCLQIAKSLNGYNWLPDPTNSNRIFTDLDCSNCNIGSITVGNCNNGTIKYNLSTSSIPIDGTSCLNQATNSHSSYDWSIESSNRLVSLKDCSSNCQLKPTKYSDSNCVGGKKREYFDISSYQTNDGLDCTTVANQRDSRIWSLDPVNNRVYTEQDCNDCILRNNFMTSNGECSSTINNKKRYFIDISKTPLDGLSCIEVAKLGNNYTWSLDSANNRVYTDINCANCDVSNAITIGQCANGSQIYTLSTSTSDDGTLCVNKARSAFPDYDWSVNNNQLVSVKDCSSDCSLGNISPPSRCDGGKISYTRNILSYPVNNGDSCINVASKDNPTLQWSLDLINKRVYSDIDCSVNCVLRNDFMYSNNQCTNNKKSYFMDISSIQIGSGLDCMQVANLLNGYNWQQDPTNSKRIITDLECSNCNIGSITVGNCNNGTIKYNLSTSSIPIDGTSCLNQATNSYSSYDWSIENNTLVSLKDCSSNCQLKSTKYSDSNCVGGKKREYFDISSYQTNDGLDCTTVANQRDSRIWSLDPINNRVYTEQDCNDCILRNNFMTSNEQCSSTINNKKRYFIDISKTPLDGLSCTEVAKLGNNYDWVLDSANNRVYTDINCANCDVSNAITIGQCANGSQTYTLSSSTSDDGTSCVNKARSAFPDYDWSFDNNQLVSVKDCSSDCSLGDISPPSSCDDGKMSYTRNILSYPVNNGESCVAVANKLSPNLQWSLDLINKRVITETNCNDCILSNISESSCNNGNVRYSTRVIRDPQGSGKSCSEVALQLFSSYGVTSANELRTYTQDGSNYIYIDRTCQDCRLKNDFMYSNSQCNNNKKSYFMDISSISIRNGKTCLEVANSLNGYNWSIDSNNSNRLVTDLECNNCNLGSITVGNCDNGTIKYNLSSSVPVDGTSCLNQASSTHSSYDWSIENNTLVSLKDCSSNCQLKPTKYSDPNCTNNKKREYVDISSYQSNTGLDCTTVANQIDGRIWSLDPVNNRVYTEKDCANCSIGPITFNDCIDGKRRYTAPITQFPNDGTSCESLLSQSRFTNISNNWQIQGNQVFTDVDCSVNCVLRNNFMTSNEECNNNKKRYFIDISSYEIGSGTNCTDIAKLTNNYEWSLDFTNKRVYTDLNCANCDISNTITIGQCANGSQIYTLSSSSSDDGTSCVNKARTTFPDHDWSFDNNQLVSVKDCSSDCSLGNISPPSSCVGGKISYTRDVLSYPVNNGESCVAVASKDNPNLQWSLDLINKRVYSDVDCSVNCVFKNDFMYSNNQCTNNKKSYFMDISSIQIGSGLNCIQVANSLNGYNWINSINNPNRIFTTLDCSNCNLGNITVGKCENGAIKYNLSSSSSPDDGTSCLNQATTTYNTYDWSIESDNRLVSLKDCSSNCQLKSTKYSDINCVDGKKREYFDILSYQTNDGLDCTTVANQRDGKLWSLDITNNRVYTEVDCSINCILKNNFMTSNEECNNNKKRYFIDISSYEIGSGTNCTNIAKINNNYDWFLDSTNKRVYTDLNCSNCDISNTITIGQCTNGSQTYTLSSSSSEDGISCVNRARTSFSDYDWSFNNNNQLVSVKDCSSDCSLGSISSSSSCDNGKIYYTRNILSYPVNNGDSCIEVASKDNPNLQWSLDLINKRVYSDVDCSVNCLLKNNFMYSLDDCSINNKKRYFIDISSTEIGAGTKCIDVAKRGNNYNWSLDEFNNKRLMTILDCSNCTLSTDIVTIGNCYDNGSIQYSLSVNQTSNDGISCINKIDNSILNTYGSDWSFNTTGNKLITQKSCDIDCVLKDNIITGNCENDKRNLYVDISSYEIGNGSNCISKANEKYGEYQWSLDVTNKRLYSEVDCRDCVLSQLTSTTCNNGKVTHKANIILESNGGLSCLEVARNRFGSEYGYDNWQIGSNIDGSRYVYKENDCVDCKLSEFSYFGSCVNNNNTLNYRIVTNANKFGKSCIEEANTLFSQSFPIGRYTNPFIVDNTRNVVYKDISCNDCELSDITIGPCENNSQRYTINISKNESGGGKICFSVANERFSSQYGFWNMGNYDYINNILYKDVSCTVPIVNCELSDEVISECIDNVKTHGADIKNYDSVTDKNSCLQVANIRYGGDWTLDQINKRVVKTEACTSPVVNCELGDVVISECIDGEKIYSYPINNYDEITDKESCLLVANSISQEDWILDSRNKRVYRIEACTTPIVNCELGDEVISECIDNVKTHRANIKNYDSVTDKNSCEELANSIYGGDWELDQINNRVVKTEACTTPIVNCELGDVVISECINDIKTYSADIKNYDEVTDKNSCLQVASSIYSGNWMLDNDNKRVVKTEACELSSDCEIENTIEESACVNGKLRYKTKINKRERGLGLSCIDVAKRIFGNKYGEDGWTIENDVVYKEIECKKSDIQVSILDKITNLFKKNSFLFLTIFIFISFIIYYVGYSKKIS